MISSKKESLDNDSCQKYDGFLNIDVFNQGVYKKLSNNISGCGDEAVKTTAPSNRIKLEYFNIDENEKSVFELGENCTTPNKDTTIKFSNINKIYRSTITTEQSPYKYEKPGFTGSIGVGGSKNTVKCHLKSTSRKNIEGEMKVIGRVEINELNDSNETKKVPMENEKNSGKNQDFQVRKAKYLQLIGNHGYLNKFDRGHERNSSRDANFVRMMNSKESDEKLMMNNRMENVRTNVKSTPEQLKMLDKTLDFSKPNEKAVRNVNKLFHSEKLPKNIRMNEEKPNNMKTYGISSHFPEFIQFSNISNHQIQGEQKSIEVNTLYQTKHHKIINSTNSSSNTSISDDTNSFQTSNSNKNQGFHCLGLEKSKFAGKRGEGDNNLLSNSSNVCMRILLPLERNLYHTSKSRPGKGVRSFKLQKQLKEKLEYDSQRKQRPVKSQQLYYNFISPEKNFIEKCFGGRTQNANSQIILSPTTIGSEHSMSTNTCRQTNQDFTSKSTSRVEFMSVHKRRSRTRNSKSRGSLHGELAKKKVFPGNIVKMREGETPCEYLNQFSSILIDNLKEPIPKDPLNLPSTCNVYVPKRKQPIPLDRYAEHIICTGTGTTVTSNVTITTGSLSKTSNSNRQSAKTSKSIIILKKISDLTKISADKNKPRKSLNEKRRINRRFNRQSDQSFVERPCCCFIQ